MFSDIHTLIIEDNEVNSFILSEILADMSNHNMRVKVCNDTLEGIDYVYREQPDIILLDLRMPKGIPSGEIFLKALRNGHFTKKIYVILVSSDMEDMKRLKYDHMANRYIPKPITVDRVLEEMTIAIKHVRSERKKVKRL